MGKDGADSIRVTTTLSRQRHDELQKRAREDGVKVAWLVRRAVERLLDIEEAAPLGTSTR